MSTKVTYMDYRLEVIDGYMRPVFDGMDQRLNELMWELLVPFTAGAAALLQEIKRVEAGESETWIFETPTTKITCTPKMLTLELKLTDDRKSEPVRIKLPLKKASLLMGRWLFECVWQEQQRRERTTAGRA